MGLDFSKTQPQSVPTTATMETTSINLVTSTVQNEIQPVESYDIVSDRNKMNQELVNSAEVDALCSKIEIDNLETIVTFGAGAAEEISKASDVVLNSMNMSQLDESSEMLKTLANIMSKFDIDEIRRILLFLESYLAI